MFSFPCFSGFMEIHFPHVFGIVYISASPKTFDKPITLECPLFPCFGSCIDFCFAQTHRLQVLMLSHAFLVLWKSTFPTF